MPSFSEGKFAAWDFVFFFGEGQALFSIMQRSKAKPVSARASREFTMAEVSAHNSASDCWIAVHGKVYNITYVFISGVERLVAGCEGLGVEHCSTAASVHPLTRSLRQSGVWLLLCFFSVPEIGPTLGGSGGRSIGFTWEIQTPSCAVGDGLCNVVRFV